MPVTLNMPPTKSVNGWNSASAPSTLLKPVSSQAGRSLNSSTSTTAPPQNTALPTVTFLQARPTSRATTVSTTQNTMNASVLPLVNRLLMPFIR